MFIHASQETTTEASNSIRFHPEYIRTNTGILKICEIVLSIITFICAIVPPWYSYGGGWIQFVSMTSFLTVLVNSIFALFGLKERLPPIFVLIELIYYCIFTVFFLIAAIVAAARGGWHPSIGAAAFFAFVTTAVYAVDTYFQFRTWQVGQTERVVMTTTTTDQNPNAREAVY